MPYHTKQQRAVLHCLETRPEETFSSAELARDLRASGSPVGLATVYRQLEKLSASWKSSPPIWSPSIISASTPAGPCFPDFATTVLKRRR